MKRGILIISLFISLQGLKAQNLVPNYSFEDTLKCATGYNDFAGYVANWTGASPWSFNFLCNGSGNGEEVPLNEVGYQYPHSGNAYAGIYTFVAPPPPARPNDSNMRDYMEVKLLDSLHSGAKYYVAFYVSLADSFKYACNDIGAYFSDSALVWTGLAKPYLTPQVANNHSNSLTDKINWVKVSGNFIAKGGEKYIVIGNFKKDKQSDSIFVNSPNSNTNHNWNGSFYYVDDVIVSTDSIYADSLFSAVNEVKDINTRVLIFPNPCHGKFSIFIENLANKPHIEIYNVLGVRVYENRLSANNTVVDLAGNGSGIYMYRVISNAGTLISSGKILIQ